MAAPLLCRGAMAIVRMAFVVGFLTTAVQTDGPIDAVQQFLAREEPQLVHYRAIRRLEAYNERFNVSG